MPNGNQYFNDERAAMIQSVHAAQMDIYRRLCSSQTPGIEPVYSDRYLRRPLDSGTWEQWSQPMSADEVARSHESNEAADIMLSINEAQPLINEQLRSEYMDLIKQNGAPTDWDQWIKKVNEPAVTKFDLMGGT